MNDFPHYDVAREEPGYLLGLTAAQAAARYAQGLHNAPVKSPTKTVGQIIRGNTFTLFNAINAVLAALILSVGDVRNVLFIGVAICNTIISSFQELRSKRAVDRLAVMTQAAATAVRDGAEISVALHEVVLDDVLHVKAGAQICADGVVLRSDGMEADESLLTGESVPVIKKEGDRVLSGSFVSAGSASIRVMAVGADNYASRLGTEAKRKKAHRSELMRALDKMLQILTFAIIPVGAALFASKYAVARGSFAPSLLSAASAMIGMIPEGLMLLVGVALAVGAINLARRRTLVQSLPCIETLARIDTLCLDKTGTITSGVLAVSELIPAEGRRAEDISDAARRLFGALPPDNATDRAMRAYFLPDGVNGATDEPHSEIIPFSPERKWSAAVFADGSAVILGAPEMAPGAVITDNFKRDIESRLALGLRVLALCLGRGGGTGGIDPSGTALLGLIVLADEIRPDACGTFEFFANQGVVLKVISGDNALAVSAIAARARLPGAENYADMSLYPDDTDFSALCEENTVFGRVSPGQKQRLVAALQKNGHIVAMTGDGVNDVLALRDADCAVAMASGSDAARSVSDFVLLDSNFESMVSVVREGRRVVNNIERVASLYLVKTIYSALLSVIFVFLPFYYPFVPVQLTPVSALCVGIPSFLLALRPNYDRLSGRFITNVLQNALPAALVTVVNLICVTLIGNAMGLSFEKTSTMSVLLIAWAGLLLLWRINSPVDRTVRALLYGVVVCVAALFGFFGGFFQLEPVWGREMLLWTPLALASWPMLWGLGKLLPRLRENVLLFLFRKRKSSRKKTP